VGAPRLVLYAGKGGVGKTTTAAATAVCAAERGRRTLVVSADAAHNLGDVLGERLGPEPRRLPLGATAAGGSLHAVEIDTRVETGRHWGRIRDYLVSLFRYQGIETVVAEELALLPGAEELTALLAVDAWAASGSWDLVVVDCAPTDTTLRFVTLPEVARGAFRLLLKLQQAVSTVVTPLARGVLSAPLPDAAVFRDAEELFYGRLRSLHRRITGAGASVRLVVTPERMVLDEARRLYTDLCLFDVPCDAVVMNRLLPPAAAEEDLFREWVRVQEDRCREVEGDFAALARLRAPLQEDEVIGAARLSRHGAALFGAEEPDGVLSRAPRMRFQRQGGRTRLRLPLPGATAGELDVARVEDQLVVRVRGSRRAVALPRRVARLELAGARLEAGELVVDFGSPAASVGGAAAGEGAG